MVGAGVIGVEYATIFRALDVALALVDAKTSLLEFVDHELVEDFIHQLRDRGMAIRFGAKVAGIEFEQGMPVTILENGRRIRSEMLLYTAGRVGATDSLNLDSCGLSTDNHGRLTVDPGTFQTAVSHIYAAGDAIGFPSLPPRQWSRGALPHATHSTCQCRRRRSSFRMASTQYRRYPRWA